MKASERGLWIGLAAALLLAIVWLASSALREEGAPAAISDARLPPAGAVLRTYDTPGGVTVHVLAEGDGEPAKPGEAMDIAYTGYLADSGALFERNLYPGLVLKNAGVIPGWIEGLADMKRRERRRLLIPSAMAYGDLRVGKVRPGADLVYDVQWAALKIEDLVEGSGDLAREGASVTVHYRGTLEDGREFDSSYDGGEPVTFALRRGGLIQGWILGLPGMRVGGKRRLWVPWHLAYGDKSKPARPGKARIEPYANLVFEIELVGVR